MWLVCSPFSSHGYFLFPCVYRCISRYPLLCSAASMLDSDQNEVSLVVLRYSGPRLSCCVVAKRKNGLIQFSSTLPRSYGFASFLHTHGKNNKRERARWCLLHQQSFGYSISQRSPVPQTASKLQHLFFSVCCSLCKGVTCYGPIIPQWRLFTLSLALLYPLLRLRSIRLAEDIKGSHHPYPGIFHGNVWLSIHC